MGLITAVSEDPEAWWRALFASHLANKSASSLRFAERAGRVELNHQIRTRLPELESMYLTELMATADANEGIGAFIDRRAPVYTNA